ncbi:hypothetical protein [Mycolicibacterium sp. CBMA 226]|uniref:hypothetical protein n=1 Tax=Mycolicibacterium sp. CBMA 226 TaxID=2606611 RepID=UPI0012DDF3D3|nr:hypothetical protein [Mycolicibacterium sp. CBMA 226]MUL75711.1 hypothetical protein [Mycolicibacterium sp. CBMA 226]
MGGEGYSQAEAEDAIFQLIDEPVPVDVEPYWNTLGRIGISAQAMALARHPLLREAKWSTVSDHVKFLTITYGSMSDGTEDDLQATIRCEIHKQVNAFHEAEAKKTEQEMGDNWVYQKEKVWKLQDGPGGVFYTKNQAALWLKTVLSSPELTELHWEFLHGLDAETMVEPPLQCLAVVNNRDAMMNGPLWETLSSSVQAWVIWVDQSEVDGLTHEVINVVVEFYDDEEVTL